MSTSPYDQGFYQAQQDDSYRSACRIVPAAKEWTGIRSVLDVGCGVGTFLQAFSEHGAEDIRGIDGSYVLPDMLRIPRDRFTGHDLGKPFDLGRRFELVLSLEVAEHLPPAAADGFVEALCRHGDVVLFSAAIPHQGGVNHVNEQWPAYWAGKFAARGYRPFDVLRAGLWNDPGVSFWYAQNTILYANDEGMRRNPRLAAHAAATPPSVPLDLVHPKMFDDKLNIIQGYIQLFNTMSARGGAFTFSRAADGTIAARPA